MTLNQLNYFYQAAMLQHFNQAAEKLNISQPSLSRSITALEDELGITLFEKSGRNVVLTKAGKIFLEHVTQILDDVKRAELKMHQLATDGGHIDIAYVSPLAREYIPQLVRSFLAISENKNITFNFHQDITVLGYARHSGLGKYTRSFFKKHDVSPNFICESPDENGIASLVAHGFGIALVADVDTIYRDDICIRPLVSNESFSHTVYMGYIRGKYQLPAVQRFIEFVKQHG